MPPFLPSALLPKSSTPVCLAQLAASSAQRSGVLLILLASLGLTACSRLTTVQNVRAHPQRNWFTRTVQLQGTVGNRAPLLQGQVYELQDRTGKIWVLSPSANLKTGMSILIRGQVRYEAIDIEGQNLGEVYIEEQQQLPPKP